MATANRFNILSTDLGKGNHHLHAAGDTIKLALTNGAPVATNTVLADITEITAQNGYSAGGADTQNDLTQSTNVANMTCVDIVWTASGGSFGPWRYMYMYNSTTATPAYPLMFWWDYGSNVTTATGETATADFGSTTLVITTS